MEEDDCTMKTTFIRLNEIWEWAITKDGKQVAGGYCRTKRDAKNDAAIWKSLNKQP